MTAINSANGPKQLMSIMSQHGQFLPAQHVALVLSRLAGFDAAGAGLTAAQQEAVRHCSAACAHAFAPCVAEAAPLDLARALYSLHRLKRLDHVRRAPMKQRQRQAGATAAARHPLS